MDYEIVKVSDDEGLKECSKLRKEVFGDEENAPEALYIIDDYDRMDDTCNYLLKVNNEFVATIRFIKIDNETIKLQRLVVPKRFRKKGYANIILKYLEEDAVKQGYKKIIMDSALSAVGFYEKNKYNSVSDVFYEDNRPHVKMEKNIK